MRQETILGRSFAVDCLVRPFSGNYFRKMLMGNFNSSFKLENHLLKVIVKTDSIILMFLA